jgi:hypothetical protein
MSHIDYQEELYGFANTVRCYLKARQEYVDSGTGKIGMETARKYYEAKELLKKGLRHVEDLEA